MGSGRKSLEDKKSYDAKNFSLLLIIPFSKKGHNLSLISKNLVK